MAEVKKITVERPEPTTVRFTDEGRKYTLKRDGKDILIAREDEKKADDGADPFWPEE